MSALCPLLQIAALKLAVGIVKPCARSVPKSSKRSAACKQTQLPQIQQPLIVNSFRQFELNAPDRWDVYRSRLRNHLWKNCSFLLSLYLVTHNNHKTKSIIFEVSSSRTSHIFFDKLLNCLGSQKSAAEDGMCHVPRSEGREDLLCRRDGPVDVLLGVRQGGEARLVLRGCQVDALTAAGLPKFRLSRYCRYGRYGCVWKLDKIRIPLNQLVNHHCPY